VRFFAWATTTTTCLKLPRVRSHHYSPCNNHTCTPKSHNQAFHIFTIAYNPYKHEVRLKVGRFTERTKGPSFLYLEIARKRGSNTRQLSTVPLRAYSRAENNRTILKRAHPNKTLVGNHEE